MFGQDPAEKGYLRFFYRDWHPTRVGRLWTRLCSWIAGFGLIPALVTLQVKDRKTGELYAHVLLSAWYEGQRYLVSMLGEGSAWVQDLRASSGAAFIKRVKSHPVTITEIPAAQRAPILKVWTQSATSGRKHLPVSPDAPLAQFESIAAEYPVFRIEEHSRYWLDGLKML